MDRLTTLLAAGLAVVALATGCSSSVANQGGDTKCKDFTSADEKTQNEAITKMLKDQGKNEPANLELAGTRLSVQTYCQTAGTQDSRISEAPHL